MKDEAKEGKLNAWKGVRISSLQMQERRNRVNCPKSRKNGRIDAPMRLCYVQRREFLELTCDSSSQFVLSWIAVQPQTYEK